MINTDKLFLDMINSPVRNIKARVELLNGSTLVSIFKCTDVLKEFSIDRVGEAKFFGYGISQKLNVKLLDKDRELNITTDNSFDVAFGVGSDYTYICPTFHVSEVHRDENTNELSITAYDILYKANSHKISEIPLTVYTIGGLAQACASKLGIPMVTNNVTDGSFDTLYSIGANFDGTESIREVLDAIAEATQTIYYVCNNSNLTFKRLDKDGDAVLTIDKAKYMELESKTNRRLTKIIHATEIGEALEVSTGVTGSTQYVRDNPFWDLREDINELLNKAIAAVGGLSINQFECSWRGNFLLEIGDKIDIVTKDHDLVTSFLLDDVINYDGTLSEVTRWSYEDNEDESAENANTLGEAIKQTYARVDKANKRIDLVASDIQSNRESIAALEINTEGINASVSKMEQNTNDALESVNGELSTLTKRVEASMTAEDVKLSIQSELTNGVGKVTTSTGFTFNDEGLTVSKSNSEMTTTITEDGMQVKKNNEAVLTANNLGVEAINLNASTYLIIGKNSRFEDYETNRTGCFWIGG